MGKREVGEAFQSYEIPTPLDVETRLSFTYRRGLGHSTDEIATGGEGKPTKVWEPEDSYQ